MNCIIIEDEIPAQRILKNFIGKVPNLNLIDTFKAAIEANSFLNSNTVDVIFLDIDMPNDAGYELVKFFVVFSMRTFHCSILCWFTWINQVVGYVLGCTKFV